MKTKLVQTANAKCNTMAARTRNGSSGSRTKSGFIKSGDLQHPMSRTRHGAPVRKPYITQVNLGNLPDAITMTPTSVAKLIERGRRKVIGTKYDPYSGLADPKSKIRHDAKEILICFIREMGYMTRQDIINHTCLILAIAKGPRVWQRIRKSVAAGNIVTAVMH